MITFDVTKDIQDVPRIVELLEHLTKTDKQYNTSDIIETARYIFSNPAYTVFVAEEAGYIVGMAMLRIDYKLAHKGQRSAHIEDVVVDPKWRGQDIGSTLVKCAVREAKRYGVYKVTLNCFSHNIKFYEKLGFHQHDVGMRLDFDKT